MQHHLRAFGCAIVLSAASGIAHAQIQFQDVTNSATDKIAAESWGLSAGDFNGDGWPDIFITNHRDRPTLYRNNGDGTFSDVILQADQNDQFTANRLIDHHLGAFADVDNDGDDDIVVRQLTRGNPSGTPNDWHRREFYADGGYLKLSGSRTSSGDEWSAELNCNTGHADWVWPQYGDLDGDGDLEYQCVYLGRYEFINPAFYSHIDLAIEDFDGDLRPEIFGLRGGSFLNDAKLVNSTRLEAFLEYTKDNGRARALFNASPPMTFTIHHKGVKETVTVTGQEPEITGGGYLRVNTVDIGYSNGNWEMKGQVITSNNFWDRYKTAYIVATNSSGISNVQVLDALPGTSPMRPRLMDWFGGEWKNRTYDFGFRDDLLCAGAAAGDFDNDKDLDIYVTCRGGVENTPNILYVNNGNGVFSRATNFGGAGPVGVGLLSRAGTSDTPITLDYNNDGYLDVAFTNGRLVQPLREGGPMTLLKNSGSGKHWIMLDMVGSAPNYSALGARIIASSGGDDQVRYQNGGFHRFSQNDNRIHFGLGNDTQVDLEIRWPNGAVETYSNVAADRIYTVTQGGSMQVRNAGPATSFPTPVSGDDCGAPRYVRALDVELFLYRENCNSNRYTVRAPGGSFGTTFRGTITSGNSGMSSFSPYSIEGNDTFTTSASSVNFVLNVGRNDVDGFSFTLNGNDACVTLTAPTKAEIVLGEDHVFAGKSIKLGNLGNCGSGPTPTLSVIPMSVSENAGTANVAVRLSSPATQNVTVKMSTREATATRPDDFYGVFRNLTFSPGETQKTVGITIRNDNTAESTEYLVARIFNSTGAPITNSEANITINDDDAGVSVLSVTPATVNESSGVASTTVTLSAPSSQTVTAAVSTRSLAPAAGWASPGSDFYGFYQALTFTPGQTQKQIQFTIVNNNTAEPNERVDVRLFNVNGAAAGATFTPITIIDDD